MGNWTRKLLPLAAAFLGGCTAAPALAYNSADADYDRAAAYARRAMDAQMNNPYSFADSYPATYFERTGWGNDSQYDTPAPQPPYVDNYNAYNGYAAALPYNNFRYGGTLRGLFTGTGANSSSPFGIGSEPGVNGYQNSPTPTPTNGAPFYGAAGAYYRGYTNNGANGYTNAGYNTSTYAGYNGYNSGTSYNASGYNYGSGSYITGVHGISGGGHSSGGHSGGGHGR